VSDPVSLAPLLAPLTALPGVGPQRAALIEKACGGGRVLDALLHLPERIAARVAVAHPAEAPAEAEAVLAVTPISARPARSRQSGIPYVEVRTEEGVTLRFMRGRLPMIEQLLPPGQRRWIAGRIRPEGEGFSCISPAVAREAAELPLLEAIWPLTEGLRRAHLAPAIRAALARIPELP
jgi:ATP-dependent DNA helicase RecG